jgi:hypothetical protein
MTTASHKQKIHFSEAEAACRLGVSRTQFRTLVRRVVDVEPNLDGAVFHASDLVLLRFLASNVSVG